MIAAELAVHLGGDLGVSSPAGIWDEIERLAPSHRGITGEVLDRLGSADGVVAPLTASPVTLSGIRPRLDPIAVPGVESVEWQGAPPRAGLAEPSVPRPGRRARGGPTGRRPASPSRRS